MTEQAASGTMADAAGDTGAHGLDAQTGAPYGHEAHHGRPASWVAVSIIIVGFIVGGIAMVPQPDLVAFLDRCRDRGRRRHHGRRRTHPGRLVLNRFIPTSSSRAVVPSLASVLGVTSNAVTRRGVTPAGRRTGSTGSRLVRDDVGEQLAGAGAGCWLADDRYPEAGRGEGVGHRVQRAVPETHQAVWPPMVHSRSSCRSRNSRPCGRPAVHEVKAKGWSTDTISRPPGLSTRRSSASAGPQSSR